MFHLGAILHLLCDEPSTLVWVRGAGYTPANTRADIASTAIESDSKLESAMASRANEVEPHHDHATSAMSSGNGDYRPSADEEFMNESQLAYFRDKLVAWKESLLREGQDTLNTLQNEPLREPDVTDRASSETDWSIELRTRDRQRKLISKIDAALRRIEEGEYGYCEVTGEPISLGRLEARPIATMTLEAQEKHERQEKVSRDE
jgi:DnaK suppressor protein